MDARDEHDAALGDADEDDDDTLIARAFQVPHGGRTTGGAEEATPSSSSDGIFSSAEDYLRFVRDEASRLPDVLVATSVPAPASEGMPPQQQQMEHPDDDGSPSTSDARDFGAFVASFAELRLGLARCDGSKFRPSRKLPKERRWALWEPLVSEGEDSVEPLLSVVLHIDERTVAWLIRCLVDDIVVRSDGADACSRRRTAWLFALSARVPKPLDDDTAASFRMLSKFCVMRQRDGDDASRSVVRLLLGIAGAYMGQDERLANRFASHARA